MLSAVLGTVLGMAFAGRTVSPLLAASGPCEGSTWPVLQKLLDEMPVFTVANAEGQPLQYQIGERQVAVFYTDVAAGKREYESARDRYPDLGCDVITVGLGQAFRLSSEGKAMVVPGIAELQAAGAPAEAEPMGQEVPLFACMGMKREGGKVPLFMCHADGAAAAADASASLSKELEMDSVFSLQSIVEELSDLDDPLEGEFVWVAPSASLQHVASYVGQGVYVRKVEEDTEGE